LQEVGAQNSETQGLETNPWAAIEDKPDPLIPTATLQIYQHIDATLTRPKDTHINRASSASLCYKRRWFQGKGVVGTPLTPRKQVNFLLGDLSERTTLHFIKEGCVGPGKLYSEVDFGEKTGEIHFQGKTLSIYKQQDLVAQIGPLTVTAHADGWGKRNSDGEWELIEVKSYSNYGFDDFKTKGAKDYLKQSTVNLQTTKAKELGAKSVRFFGLRKETGHLWDRRFEFDPALAFIVEAEYLAALADEEPKTPYQPVAETFRKKPTGRMILPFPCNGYCPYTEKCFSNFTIDWKAGQFGQKTPVYVVTQENSDAVQTAS